MDFKNLTRDELAELSKALTTNNYAQVGGPEGQTGGAALIPESLENSLRTLTFTESHFKLWKNIHKSKAFSTVEEFNTIDSYGPDFMGFQREGVAGVDTTANYQRNHAKIKNINTTRSVSNLMGHLVKATENPINLEIKNGMTYVLGQTEQALFYGDSSLAADGNEGVQWDGIIKQAAKENELDLRGSDLTDKHLNRATETVLNNYGFPNAVYMPTETAAVFSENYYPNQRALMNNTPGSITAGTVITQFNTVGGTLDLQNSVLMRRGLKPLDVSQMGINPKAPTPPTVAAATDATAGIPAGSAFENGTYKYAIVAVNTEGNSAPQITGGVAVTGATNAQGVKLTITNSAVQLTAPEYFDIYRTERDGSKFYFIGSVGATTSAASGVTVFVDKNDVLPNTGTAIVGDFSQESLTFRQLAPMFKLDYALTAPIHRFGIFLYGTPIIYAPKRFVVIKNIKSHRA